MTANIIQRVFMIRYGKASATAFVIDVDNRQYLVTARHVVHTMSDRDKLEIYSNGSWCDLDVMLVGHAEGGVDISVLAPTSVLVPHALPVVASTEGLVYGQDVYFLGFPYGWSEEIVVGDAGYPLPFVKKAIVSLFGAEVWILDGHNNRGFSGAPVVFMNSERSVQVCAVVSGYRWVKQAIHGEAMEAKYSYQYNTGLMNVYRIDFALDLIFQNPIGTTLSPK